MDGLADDAFLFGALDVIDVGKIVHQRSSGLAMIDVLMGNSKSKEMLHRQCIKMYVVSDFRDWLCVAIVDVQLLLLEAFTRFDEDNSGKIDVLEMVEMLLTCISFLGDAACAMETTWSQCMPLAPPPKK